MATFVPAPDQVQRRLAFDHRAEHTSVSRQYTRSMEDRRGSILRPHRLLPTDPHTQWTNNRGPVSNVPLRLVMAEIRPHVIASTARRPRARAWSSRLDSTGIRSYRGHDRDDAALGPALHLRSRERIMGSGSVAGARGDSPAYAVTARELRYACVSREGAGPRCLKAAIHGFDARTSSI